MSLHCLRCLAVELWIIFWELGPSQLGRERNGDACCFAMHLRGTFRMFTWEPGSWLEAEEVISFKISNSKTWKSCVVVPKTGPEQVVWSWVFMVPAA